MQTRVLQTGTPGAQELSACAGLADISPMAGRGSYGALPDADFADEHNHGHDPVLPPVSTGARRRNAPPENGGAHVDGYHFTAAAHATDGLGVQAPTSGAFGAALQGHRDGSRPANVAETLQGTAFP